MGQVLMTNVEVGMGKAQTLTLPRKYYALLLFFNYLEPSRDTRKKGQVTFLSLTKKQNSQG